MSSIRKLASAYGVLASYYGVAGLARARPDALLEVLRTLGAPVGSLGDAERALRERREAAERCLVEPVLTIWERAASSVLLTHRRHESGRVRFRVTLEDQSTIENELDLESLEIASTRRGLVRRRLPLPELPSGYHRTVIELGARRAESTVLCAPRIGFRRDDVDRRREWGLFAPLYGITSDATFGAGDFSDLGHFADLVGSNRGQFIATLPLLSTFVDEPSPYSPVSRLFWNELYVDPRLAFEWDSVRNLASSPDFFSRLEALRREPRVDYRRLSELKRPLLEAMSREALRSRPGSLEDFARARLEASAYARFRAAAERSNTPSPHSDFGDEAYLYYFYAQMLAEEQIASASRSAAASGVRFYFDMPVGVHGDGFDTWRDRSLFASGVDVGAPPDPVFPDGQNWGFPPVLPERSRATGHRYWRECLAHAMRHAGYLRIDHVMGMHRLFWIPAGFEKREGVYVRYPAEELYAVANIESHRHRCELVGENLGIVPEAVNGAIERHRWRGIYVLQFSLTGDREKPLAPIPVEAVASFNTHDTPTFAGFRKCRDLEDRVEAGLLDREKAMELARERAAAIAALDAKLGVPSDGREVRREHIQRWLEVLLGSAAGLVAITLEDLWLEEEPQNVPGRVDQRNWRRKLRYRLRELPPEVVLTLASISRRA